MPIPATIIMSETSSMDVTIFPSKPWDENYWCIQDSTNKYLFASDQIVFFTRFVTPDAIMMKIGQDNKIFVHDTIPIRFCEKQNKFSLIEGDPVHMIV